MTAERPDRDVEALAAVRFQVASVHHFHGNDCLCGYSSARSRSRTEHILDAILASEPIAALIAEAEQRGREDNADHGLCYVSGSRALAELVASERASALREAAEHPAPLVLDVPEYDYERPAKRTP